MLNEDLLSLFFGGGQNEGVGAQRCRGIVSNTVAKVKDCKVSSCPTERKQPLL